MKLVLEREFELRNQRTIATIHESETDGASRRLITGREPHPTGSPVCVKSRFRAVPWESMDSEYPLTKLAEVSSPVRQLKSQPHRLDMKVVGGSSPALTFYPDYEFAADARFLEELERDMPFWVAALRWEPNSESFDWRTLIVEVKRDDDRRAVDPDYLHKLELARELYRKIGWSFAHLRASKDLPSGRVAKGVNRVWSRAMTRVNVLDVARVSHVIDRAGGRTTYDEASAALGQGPVGRSKLAALHVRRVVRIDLSNGLTPDSSVVLVNDGGAIL